MIPFRTFCLTLPENPQRTFKAKEHFESRGLPVEFFNAIHGPTAGLSTIHPYEVDNPGSGFRMGFVPTGIFLAHYNLWMALQLLPDAHFLVLEDDAQFPDDWKPRFESALADSPPDFDMLYVGSCCCKGLPKTQINGIVWEVKYPQCTHAYIVAKKALPTLLSTNRRIWAPIDIAMTFHSHPKMKVLTCLPRIVTQFDTNIPE